MPSEKNIRNYGHKIPELYTACHSIAGQQNIGFHFRYKMDEEIHCAIVNLLGSFAETSGRYSNLNVLLGQEDRSNDCIEQWHDHVDIPLYDKHISQRRKNGIDNRSLVIGNIMDQFAVTLFMAEDKTVIRNAAEASRHTGVWEAVAPYRQLYVLQIIRYLTELLRGLGYKAMAVNPEDIPHFGEIFGIFYNDNAYFRSRKTWDKP